MMLNWKQSQAGRLRMLEVWSAVGAVALLAATHALWFPRSLDDAFPQVPLLQAFCGWPVLADTVCAGWLIAGWLMILLGWRQAGCLSVLVTGCLLICLNQHRLQPWHCQLLIFALIFSLVSPQLQLKALRIMVVSIYVFSALSKLDYEFLHTVGQQFLEQLLSFVGLDNFSGSTGILMASIIPVAELALALGLVFPKTRPWAGVGVCGMHCLLLLILGPWGLNHSWGVLLWNVYFIGLAWLLFVWPVASDATHSDSSSPLLNSQSASPPSSSEELASTGRSSWNVRLKLGDWLAAVMLLPLLVMPVGERFGLWDHWPSWALYAPHSSRVEIFVATTAIERLPESLQAITPPPVGNPLWVRLPIASWSLTTLGVPVYPQARFQLGVARSLAEKLSTEFELRVDILGVASRFTGRRTTQRREGMTALRRASEHYFFSTLPRKGGR